MSARVAAEPSVLVWARQKAGLSVEAAARKVLVSAQRLSQWESGESLPTVKQLRRLAGAYKRPLAIFCLPEPPRDFAPLSDMRVLPDVVPHHYSERLCYEIRRAHQRRELVLELHEMLWGAPPQLGVSLDRAEGPEQAAERLRSALQVPLKSQKQWPQGYGTFRRWRAVIELRGVLVFEAYRVELEEMRGFAIAQSPFPVVVVNMKDAINGRVFSLLHELVHVALDQSTLCDFREGPGSESSSQVEVFCNATAAAALVPQADFLSQSVVARNRRAAHWSDEHIEGLARLYGVSREVIVRRLLTLGRATRRFYVSKRDQYLGESQRIREERTKTGGFPHPSLVAFNRSGPLFTNLVLTSYHEGNITASDVADFLEVRLKHMAAMHAHAAREPRIGEGAV